MPQGGKGIPVPALGMSEPELAAACWRAARSGRGIGIRNLHYGVSVLGASVSEPGLLSPARNQVPVSVPNSFKE
jgi:hypothetical protein